MTAPAPSLQPLPPAARPARRTPYAWLWRLQLWLSHYLPLALLAFGALFTTWLVRQSPPVAGPMVERPTRTTPDYTMSGFELLRYLPDGRQQAWLKGETLRHFPHNDQIEIDKLQLRWVDEAGRLLVATAQRGSGPAKGDRLHLEGAVRVQRFPAPAPGTEPASQAAAEPEWVLQTEALEAWAPQERLFSRQPTTLTTPTLQVRGRGFEYHHARGELAFVGPTRAELQAPRRP